MVAAGKPIVSENGKNGNGNGSNNAVLIAISAASIILSLGNAFWTNSQGSVASVKTDLRDDMKQAESRQQREIDDLKKIIEDKLFTKDEQRDFVVNYADTIKEIRKRSDAIQGELVSRSEHQQHWIDTDAKIGDLRDQVKGLTGSWNVGKQLDNLQKEVDDLRNHGPALSAPLPVLPLPGAK